MKEEQTLEDILIPIEVKLIKKDYKVVDFQSVLFNIFSSSDDKNPHRLIILGPPGSGKTVAIRVAAREIWNIPSPKGKESLIPALITFSDYKRTGFDLESALIQSFRIQKFTKGEDKNEVRDFVCYNLYEGNILILIDALDELELKDRNLAVHELKNFLKIHPEIPTIITCRTAVYKRQFDNLKPEQIEIGDFSPNSIRIFVNNWQFKYPKSGIELWMTIQKRPHLREIAKNPLMLTIIAYLYSHPKYRLPENRALFYDVCIRALLEEWDQTMHPERANQYNRHHKEAILGRIAFSHINSQEPDKEIDRRMTLKQIGRWMDNLGLLRGENIQMLEEIVINSGLLIFLEPNGLRFPHQTFLEFFVAKYFISEKSAEELISKYKIDKQRWREVILLYLGLNSEKKELNKINKYIYENENIELVVKSLSESQMINPDYTRLIIKKIKNAIENQPTLNLLTNLGVLSSNPRLAISKEVHLILLQKLRSNEKLPNVILQELILSILRNPTEEAIMFIVNNYERLDLQRIILEMGEEAIILLKQIINLPKLTFKKKQELIEGLQLAGNSKILIEIMLFTDDKRIKHLAAIALAKLSKNFEFWEYLNSNEINQFPIDDVILNIEKTWGWPYKNPKNVAGRRLIYLICFYIANEIKKGLSFIGEIEKEIHPRISYLSIAIAMKEKSVRDSLKRKKIDTSLSFLGLVNHMISASNRTLLSLWKLQKKESSKRIINSIGDNFEVLWILPIIILNIIITILPLIPVGSYLLGWSSLGFLWPEIFYLSITFLIIFILAYLVGGKEDGLFYAIGGPMLFFVVDKAEYNSYYLFCIIMTLYALVFIMIGMYINNIYLMILFISKIYCYILLSFSAFTTPPYFPNNKTYTLLQIIQTNIPIKGKPIKLPVTWFEILRERRKSGLT
jgi:hypothetical protein